MCTVTIVAPLRLTIREVPYQSARCCCELWLLERHANMALCCKVVDLQGPYLSAVKTRIESMMCSADLSLLWTGPSHSARIVRALHDFT